MCGPAEGDGDYAAPFEVCCAPTLARTTTTTGNSHQKGGIVRAAPGQKCGGGGGEGEPRTQSSRVGDRLERGVQGKPVSLFNS
jgi:hypothetical protein